MKRIGAFLALASAGAVAVAAGIGWDAVRHGRGTATHGDSVMGLDDPSHVLIGVGFTVLVAGVTGALHGYLHMEGRRWASRAVVGAAMTAGAVVGTAVAWAEVRGVAQSHDHVHVEAAAVDDEDAHHLGAHHDDAAPEQRAAAKRLYEETKRGIARFEDVEVARATGYEPVTPETIPLVHYLNRAYVENGRVLDPERPESLVYLHTPNGEAILLGAMYVMPIPGIPGPRMGGPITHWHTHTNLCFTGEWQVVAFVDSEGGCPSGSVRIETPEMLHVWTVPHPGGPFAHDIDPATLLQIASTGP